MALSGIHCEFGWVTALSSQGHTIQIIDGHNIDFTENKTTAGTTSGAASTSVGPRRGQPVVTVTAVADSWIAIGTAPDSTTNPRFFCPAGIPRSFAIVAGDKVNWSAA